MDSLLTQNRTYYRRLNYGAIKLVPVQDGNESYPFTQEKYKDAWHVPGRTINTTAQLVNLANSKGIIVTMTESSGNIKLVYNFTVHW